MNSRRKKTLPVHLEKMEHQVFFLLIIASYGTTCLNEISTPQKKNRNVKPKLFFFLLSAEIDCPLRSQAEKHLDFVLLKQYFFCSALNFFSVELFHEEQIRILTEVENCHGNCRMFFVPVGL